MRSKKEEKGASIPSTCIDAGVIRDNCIIWNEVILMELKDARVFTQLKESRKYLLCFSSKKKYTLLVDPPSNNNSKLDLLIMI